MVSEERNDEQQEKPERLPWQQMLMDDMYLLVAAGLVIPTLFYIVWGLWDLANVGSFPLIDR